MLGSPPKRAGLAVSTTKITSRSAAPSSAVRGTTALAPGSSFKGGAMRSGWWTANTASTPSWAKAPPSASAEPRLSASESRCDSTNGRRAR